MCKTSTYRVVLPRLVSHYLSTKYIVCISQASHGCVFINFSLLRHICDITGKGEFRESSFSLRKLSPPRNAYDLGFNMKSEAEELKRQGNESMKSGNYTEAVFHYTHAIKIEPKNHILYSNRSAAFLKIQQFYLALQDATKTIQLEPNWPKGYFRKGEVEFQAKHFSEALKSYNHAYVLDCTDEGIGSAISKTTREINRLKKAAKQEPLVFTSIGGAVGIIIVTADQYIANKPSIPHWFFQIILIIILSGLGFLVCKLYRYMLSMQQSSLLDPPPDLLSELNGTASSSTETMESEIPKHQHQGAKGGRQRYRKGKS